MMDWLWQENLEKNGMEPVLTQYTNIILGQFEHSYGTGIGTRLNPF
jgi:hypothetical protein